MIHLVSLCRLLVNRLIVMVEVVLAIASIGYGG
jgi:hypothetical protein